MTDAVVPVPEVQNWLHSSFYKEAVENVVLYNSQLMKDRKNRLPYVDAQTGIAQSNSHLLRSRLDRRRGAHPGQIYSYPPRRWRRETKPQPVTKKELQQVEQATNHSASPAGLIQTVEGGVVTKRSSRIAGMSRTKEPVEGVAMPVSVRVPLESPVSSEMNEEEESPDADLDYLDEYDSEEERKLKKKKRPNTRVRSSAIPTRGSTRGSGGGDSTDDKPFLCTVCNRRYKTAASLKAHRTQYHSGEVATPARLPSTTSTVHVSSSPAVPAPPPVPDARVAVTLPPPPNLRDKEDAKPNPYCDFCLGDNLTNKKNSKQEKMVSCANCGRSAHPSCMQFSTSLAAVVRTYRWQCIECKSCHFCGTSENDDQLLFCDDCDRGYHMYCLKPPLKEPPEGSWSCGMCFKRLH